MVILSLEYSCNSFNILIAIPTGKSALPKLFLNLMQMFLFHSLCTEESISPFLWGWGGWKPAWQSGKDQLIAHRHWGLHECMPGMLCSTWDTIGDGGLVACEWALKGIVCFMGLQKHSRAFCMRVISRGPDSIDPQFVTLNLMTFRQEVERHSR